VKANFPPSGRHEPYCPAAEITRQVHIVASPCYIRIDVDNGRQSARQVFQAYNDLTELQGPEFKDAIVLQITCRVIKPVIL
jgi:hypothetical protein